MSFPYTRDRPDPPNNPSSDVPDMKINTNSTDSIIGVDHVGFNLPNGGYHTIIHQGVQASDPAAIPNINQVYTKLYTPDTTVGSITDTQLFSRTGVGGISQLTGAFATFEGYQWCGSILVQWGRLTPVTGGSFAGGNAFGTVIFKDRANSLIPFPTFCLSVIATPFWNAVTPAAAGTVTIDVSTLSNLKFDWKFNSLTTLYTGFMWVAIGI